MQMNARANPRVQLVLLLLIGRFGRVWFGCTEQLVESLWITVIKLELHSVQCDRVGRWITVELVDDKLVEGHRAIIRNALAAAVTGTVIAGTVIAGTVIAGTIATGIAFIGNGWRGRRDVVVIVGAT
ncbi:MAG: hypothetical protein KY410_00765 [Proteobacteria bacterium]|nr:hypothetical protein [Pseudomonadota bacterium]